jgi:hypothetical protein
MSKYIIMTHMPGVNNPADILSKHWVSRHISYFEADTFLFGNMANLIQEG